MPQWHPHIKDSRIEGGRASDTVGCVRAFHLQDGALIRETLLSLSDDEHSFSYDMLDSPLPVVGYKAGITLRRVTDGDQTFAVWTAEFATDPPEAEAETVAIVTGVFSDGLGALAKTLGGGR